MRKIPTVFQRDYTVLTDEITPGCEWVRAGEGVATRKYDGTCVMFDGESWWTRREVKPGKEAPPSFQEVDYDEVTGKRIGWERADLSAFSAQLAEAVEQAHDWPVGTYELIGPKINKNPEGAPRHILQPHERAERVILPDRSFYSLRTALEDLGSLAGWEGIVFHHEDGRMAKIKVRDFR